MWAWTQTLRSEVEQLAINQWVAGSTPASFKNCLRILSMNWLTRFGENFFVSLSHFF